MQCSKESSCSIYSAGKIAEHGGAIEDHFDPARCDEKTDALCTSALPPRTLPLWRRKCHKVAPALQVGSSRAMRPLPTTHTSSTSFCRTTRADLWKSPRSNQAIACWTSRAALVL